MVSGGGEGADTVMMGTTDKAPTLGKAPAPGKTLALAPAPTLDGTPTLSMDSSGDDADITELFGDIDWANVNLGELEQQWRAELTALEEENVRSLIESADRTHLVLPGLLRAIDEVTSVENLLDDYCKRLQLMGLEIQQIEELNRGLYLQTANQQKLLEELDSILSRITLPDNVLALLDSSPLDDPKQTNAIAEAATSTFQLVNTKFEDGIGSMAAVIEQVEFYAALLKRFVERLSKFFVSTFAAYKDRFIEGKRTSKKIVLGLSGLEELSPFLSSYSSLISAIRLMDTRKHIEVVTAYQSEMSTIFKRETTDLVEYLKNNKMIRRGTDEKNYLFASLSTDKMAAVGERLISMGQRPSGIPSTRDFFSIPLSDPSKRPELDPNEILLPDQLLNYLIVTISLVMIKQQNICAETFYGIEDSASERILKMVDSMMMAAFSPVEEILGNFVDSITKPDHSAALELLVVLDIRIPQITDELAILGKMLTNLRRKLLSVVDQFIIDQVNVIEAMKFSARKRSGIFPYVSLFPTFITRMEKIVSAAPAGITRDTMNKGYEKITATIFKSLDALAAEAERSADEKERINASVMNIQNGHYLVEQLRSIKSPAVQASLSLAHKRYEHHLGLYSALSLHRFFSRLLDFFDGMEAMLENTPSEEVAFHASYNKASAKRVLQAYPVREVRKNLEMVWIRVEKHFSGDRALQQVVWRALQEYFVKSSTRFAESIQQVYPGTDVQLGYSVADVMACFSEIARF